MKSLLFICGPNGIGKTTVSREAVKLIPNSAYVDSDFLRIMNPFVLDDNTVPTIAKNISDLITNYLNCPAVETVIFSYGFHGRRKEIFDTVINSISHIKYRFIPFLLWCGESENIRRMKLDGRDSERIERALKQSRDVYFNINYPLIDVTNLSAEESARLIIKKAKL